MLKVVIDTNVLISAAILNKGNPAYIINLISKGKVKMYYSSEIIDEYTEVLARDKFSFSVTKQKAVIKKIEEVGQLIKPKASVIPFPDESDRKFYDTAAAVKAYLITGNTKHYPEEPHIVTPSQFITCFPAGFSISSLI